MKLESISRSIFPVFFLDELSLSLTSNSESCCNMTEQGRNMDEHLDRGFFRIYLEYLYIHTHKNVAREAVLYERIINKKILSSFVLKKFFMAVLE